MWLSFTVSLLFPSLMRRGNTEKQEIRVKKSKIIYDNFVFKLLPIKGYLKARDILSFKRFCIQQYVNHISSCELIN